MSATLLTSIGVAAQMHSVGAAIIHRVEHLPLDDFKIVMGNDPVLNTWAIEASFTTGGTHFTIEVSRTSAATHHFRFLEGTTKSIVQTHGSIEVALSQLAGIIDKYVG